MHDGMFQLTMSVSITAHQTIIDNVIMNIFINIIPCIHLSLTDKTVFLNHNVRITDAAIVESNVILVALQP